MGLPEVAGKDRGKIFGELYDEIFNDDVTAPRLLVPLRVFEPIEDRKKALQRAVRRGEKYDTNLLSLVDGAYHLLFATAELCSLRNVDHWEAHQAVLQIEDAVRVVQDLRINHALHLTLCFLGDTPSRAVPQLSEALAGVPFRRCSLAFGEPTFLPERGKKNVVALPLADAAQESGGLAAVRELQAGVGAALAASGFYQLERRAYLPHVTVTRFRRPSHHLSLHMINLPELCPSRLVLYTGDLDKAAGAVHTPFAEFTPR